MDTLTVVLFILVSNLSPFQRGGSPELPTHPQAVYVLTYLCPRSVSFVFGHVPDLVTEVRI